MEQNGICAEEMSALRRHVQGNFRIWDAHMHIGTDIDAKEMKAAALVNFMAAKRIEKAVIFPLDDPKKGESFTVPNIAIYRICRKFPKRFIPFFRLNPNARWKEEFARCSYSGFAGIKLHPRSQNFSIDSEEAKNIYYSAERAGLPVLIHTGKGLADIARKIFTLSRQFPELTIIAGHSVHVDIDSAVRLLGKRENVYFELSATKPEAMLDVMNNIPAERILYGTDSPYLHIDTMMDRVLEAYCQSSLDRAALRKIFAGNLKRILEK